MERYLQAAAMVLVAVVLNLVLRKRDKELALLLTLAVCAIVLLAGLAYLAPVMDFLEELAQAGQMDPDWIGILLKVTGIGLLAEIAALVCADAGESALGKTVQILSAGVILWLSLPLLTALLNLVREILEGV